MAIVEGKIKVSFSEWVRAHKRYDKRMLKLIARLDSWTHKLKGLNAYFSVPKGKAPYRKVQCCPVVRSC